MSSYSAFMQYSVYFEGGWGSIDYATHRVELRYNKAILFLTFIEYWVCRVASFLFLGPRKRIV